MRRLAIRLVLGGVLSFLAACSSTPNPLPPPSLSSVQPNSGSTAGGTAVTIAGANFQVGASVHFGSVPATGVTVNSAASISAVTPAGAAGAVDVTVTNPDSQSAVLPSGFRYLAPCLLPSTVTSNMTLDDSCIWTVAATVTVGGPSNPVLTILAGTTVEFAPSTGGNNGAALRVGADGQPGSLVANGTSASGILLTSESLSPAPGDWGGVLIGPMGGGTSMEYVTIDYAGGAGGNDLPNADAAGLTVEGGDVSSGSASQTPAPLVSYVTVHNSAGHGLVFAGLDTGFGPNSGYISVMNWELTEHFPLVIEANEGGTVPTTISATPSTSASAVVAIQTFVNQFCAVEASTTWPAIPLPYFIETTVQVISSGPTGPDDTLTIAAPNTVEFASGTELDVDPPPAGANSQSNGNSYLVAAGSPGNSITFTSGAASPGLGDWAGLNFWCTNANQSTGSSLSYATIEWAAAVKNSGPTGTGEIAIGDGQQTANGPLGPVIANCSFLNYGTATSDYGIALFDVSNVSLSNYLSANNTFATAYQAIQYCSGQITDGTCNP